MTRPKSVEQLRASGTFRPDRHGARGLGHNGMAVTDPDELPVPDSVTADPEALAMWHCTVATLCELSTLSEADVPALEQLCLTHAMWRRVAGDVLQAGVSYEAVSDKGHPVEKRRPVAAEVIALGKERRALLGHFGLLPDRRDAVQKLIPATGEDDVDPFAFLNEKNLESTYP